MEICWDAQVVLSTFRSRSFSNRPLHSEGFYVQFPQLLTLAHGIVPSTIKNQVSTSVIELDFPPFTDTLPATLASRVFFAFYTQIFRLQL